MARQPIVAIPRGGVFWCTSYGLPHDTDGRARRLLAGTAAVPASRSVPGGSKRIRIQYSFLIFVDFHP